MMSTLPSRNHALDIYEYSCHATVLFVFFFFVLSKSSWPSVTLVSVMATLPADTG